MSEGKLEVKMKKDRQDKILEIIARNEVDTQDELIELLKAQNYHVTQATVSRDMKELDLVKVTTPEGAYKYVQNVYNTPRRKRYSTVQSLSGAVTSVDHAQNIVVIKTAPGLSGAIGVAIDRMDEPEVLGCVAGDDTLMVVTTDKESARDFSSRVKELLSAVEY